MGMICIGHISVILYVKVNLCSIKCNYKIAWLLAAQAHTYMMSRKPWSVRLSPSNQKIAIDAAEQFFVCLSPDFAAILAYTYIMNAGKISFQTDQLH